MSADPDNVEVGSAAPGFNLESNRGNTVRLADYQGRKFVVLYFMREFS